MTRLTPEQEAALNARASRQAPTATLSADERARIEAEETYRAQVRGNLAYQAQRQNAPSYWTGFILNLLVIGLGFFVIGEVVWGIVWLIAALVVNLNTAFITLPLFWIGVLIHYRVVYARKYS